MYLSLVDKLNPASSESGELFVINDSLGSLSLDKSNIFTGRNEVGPR